MSLRGSCGGHTAPTFSLASAIRITRPVHAPMRIDSFESQMSPRLSPRDTRADHQHDGRRLGAAEVLAW
jgi:hypothetical protein